MEGSDSRQITAEAAWKITCHEAGHAVVAARLKVPFCYVRRKGGNQDLTEVAVGPLESTEDNRTQEEIARWQQFYAAGAAAELLLFGCYRPYAASRDRFLHDKCEKMRQQSRNDGWEDDIESALIVLNRDSIEKVAKELDRNGELSDEEVCDLLGCPYSWDE